MDLSSSVTTAIPVGPIHEYCIASPYAGFFNYDEKYTCANSTRGTVPSDFQTFCCDGWIIDTTQDIWDMSRGPWLEIELQNMVCCRLTGPQPGGLFGIQPHPILTCTEGTPTPLASLAATNIDNVQPFLVTYTSASGGVSTTGDFIPTRTAYCLWADTAHGVAMTTVTVPAAKIVTLPTDTSTTSWLYMSYANTSKTVATTNKTVATSARLASAGASLSPQSHIGAAKLMLLAGLVYSIFASSIM